VKLKCIRCGAVGLRDNGGSWKCEGCAAQFPVLAQVPRFVNEEIYSESFGFQWNRFARTQLDSASGTTRSRDTFVQKTGWSLNDLRGKRVLDAGCGMGRFTEVCADAGAEVHAVDLSRAVEAASRNLEHRPNVHIYQADIMDLPFPNESFDFIYSIGVLHHTPNTKAAFLQLPPLLKAGGAIAIWVYSTRLRLLWGGEILRKLTPSVPKSWLLRASKIAIPLYQVHRTPLIGMVTSIVLPTSMDPNPQWRWLDTFDWYSPKYQWKHAYAEVEGWFREAGLIEIRRGQFPVAVSGIRPPSSVV
jgi:SAM-dependent methyltransferase